MNYRKEIDGLRAIAVLSVVLFHADLNTLSGGYLGVDIFFVISGYLITSIINSDLSKGCFNLKTFYEKRCRRILPSLFTVLLVCIPLAYLLLLPSELKSFSRSLLYTVISTSNIYFFRSINYFNPASESMPLLHTWSLGVEEQFYFLFPSLLIFLHKRKPQVKNITLTVLLIFSLALSQWLFSQNPLANFYLLPSRIWELLFGALTAIYLSNNTIKPENRITQEILSTIGLIMVLTAIFTFNKNTPNPSFYSLIPVFGTTLVIVYTKPKQIVGQLLSSKILVGFGLISYSTYLWHQPIFAFLRVKYLGQLSNTITLFGLVITFLLAFLSWKYIETPFRNLKKFNQKTIFTYSIGFIFLFVGLGSIGENNQGFPNRYHLPQSIAYDFISDQEMLIDCYQHEVCYMGDQKSDITNIAIFGDSHAQALMPAFHLLGKASKEKITFIGKGGGCLPILDIHILSGPLTLGACEKITQQQLAYVKKFHPKKIFLASRWSVFYDDAQDGGRGIFYLGHKQNSPQNVENSIATLKEGLEKTIKTYQDLGAEVYIIGQIPQQRFDVKEYYYSIYSTQSDENYKINLINNYSVSLEQHLKLQKINRDIFIHSQNNKLGKFINLDSEFCDESRCYIGTIDHSYYRDSNHISVFGAEKLAPFLKSYALN